MEREIVVITCDVCGKEAPRLQGGGRVVAELRAAAAEFGWHEVRYREMFFDTCSLACFRKLARSFPEYVENHEEEL